MQQWTSVWYELFIISGVAREGMLRASAPGRQEWGAQNEDYNYLLILVFILMLHFYVILKIFLKKVIRFDFGTYNMSSCYELYRF